MNQTNQRNISKTNQNTNIENVLNGLSLSGTIIDRTRRMVPHDKPTTEIVTYTIQDNCSRKYYVDDYAPNEYYDLLSNVCLPVYIKTYSRKNGEPSYTINIQKSVTVRGEHF